MSAGFDGGEHAADPEAPADVRAEELQEKEFIKEIFSDVDVPKDSDGVNPVTRVGSSSSSNFSMVAEPSSDTVPPSPKDETSEQGKKTIETEEEELKHPREQKRTMEENLREKNLQRKRVAADGNCLFAAFADQVKKVAGENVTAQALRELIASNARDMMTNEDSPFRNFVNQETLEDDLSRFAKDGVWNFAGNDLAPQMLGTLLGLNVCIFQSDGTVQKYRSDNRPFQPEINVILDNDHYDSTGPLETNNFVPRWESVDIDTMGRGLFGARGIFDRTTSKGLGSRSGPERSDDRKLEPKELLQYFRDLAEDFESFHLERLPDNAVSPSLGKATLVLFAGGTFGMKKETTGMKLKEDVDHDLFSHLERLFPVDSSETQLVWKFVKAPIRLSGDRNTVWFYSLAKPIDSTEATVQSWEEIRDAIKVFSGYISGVVVIHGTDTLAWSASAMHFMMRVPFPVVFTASQISIFERYSDAPNNFVGALDCVRYPFSCERCSEPQHLHGVFVYFNGALMRAVQVRKTDSSGLDAFKAKGSLPLAEIKDGLLRFNGANYFLHHEDKGFRNNEQVFYGVNRNVVLVKLFPGLTAESFTLLIKGSCGVVIEAYGAGNIPKRIFDVIKDHNKTFFACVTQCFEGSVTNQYDVSSEKRTLVNFLDFQDMTPEAATTFLSVQLARAPPFNWNVWESPEPWNVFEAALTKYFKRIKEVFFEYRRQESSHF